MSIQIEYKSKRFFGGRIFLQQHFKDIQPRADDFESQEYIKRCISNLFPDFCDELNDIDQKLIVIFKDFIFGIYQFCFSNNFNYEKTTTFIEIAFHIFEKSFEKHLSLDQSFQKFREIIVRHTLFRPPHSILVFNLDELKSLTKYMLDTFYKHYNLYFHCFTPFLNVEIRTIEPFKNNFPLVESLQGCETIDRANIPLLDEYMIDKETGLTPEQLAEIMRGDSIHVVPLKKREEWLRLKQEREKKQKIDRAMNRELERLNQIMEDKMKEQDENFLIKLQELKAKPGGVKK